VALGVTTAPLGFLRELMLPQLIPAVLAALVAWAAGGSLHGLARPIAWWPLGLLAIGIELGLGRIPVVEQPWLAVWGHWLWAASVALIFLVLLRNTHVARGAARLAWAAAALGVGLNLLVITANGGYMPVTQAGLEETGQATKLEARGAVRRDLLIDDHTRLAWLADVLVEPSWVPGPVVASIGDRLLTVGLAGWAFASVFETRRRRSGHALDPVPG
jgi:uncharacterized protein DUF5317